MTKNLTSIDPYSPSVGYYECLECSYRESSAERLGTCPMCEGQVHNIAVPRE
ncbi:rubrerythrin-like domain-containing protein [Halorubrum sp. JWXQ-INN 858]|uniref:rubrerythrin-like domain-containing protein n=1 Tax=Halorubrum sp. JWXQ-INN 858 TaxID=2690782 RepID=UPI00190F681A|nr:rubrerythrin-like domain-containing protein [Halorubrum sp. JWXQ-INN 858]